MYGELYETDLNNSTSGLRSRIVYFGLTIEFSFLFPDFF